MSTQAILATLRPFPSGLINCFAIVPIDIGSKSINTEYVRFWWPSILINQSSFPHSHILITYHSWASLPLTVLSPYQYLEPLYNQLEPEFEHKMIGACSVFERYLSSLITLILELHVVTGMIKKKFFRPVIGWQTVKVWILWFCYMIQEL